MTPQELVLGAEELKALDSVSCLGTGEKVLQISYKNDLGRREASVWVWGVPVLHHCSQESRQSVLDSVVCQDLLCLSAAICWKDSLAEVRAGLELWAVTGCSRDRLHTCLESP